MPAVIRLFILDTAVNPHLALSRLATEETAIEIKTANTTHPVIYPFALGHHSGGTRQGAARSFKEKRMKVSRVCALFFIFIASTLIVAVAHAGLLEGESVGTFGSPQPTCPPAVCTGAGTDFFTWGEPADVPEGHVSSLHFLSGTFSVAVGEIFDVGEVAYFNGTTNTGTGVNEVDLCIEVTTTEPNSYSDCRIVYIINTLNTGDPLESADGVSMDMGPDFFVLEGGEAQATVQARLVSSMGMAGESGGQVALEIVGFGEVTSEGGFLRHYSYLPLVQH